MVNRFIMLLGGLLIFTAAAFLGHQSATAVDSNVPTLSEPARIHQQSAQTTTIEFGGTLGEVYRPADVRISPGDSIQWLGDFAVHPLVSDDGLWQTVSSGTQFTYTYDLPGIYPYHCAVHDALGMNGSVTVGFFGYLPLITK